MKYNPSRIIIVDTEVEDLSLAEFVTALRDVRTAEFLHILVISSERTEEFVAELDEKLSDINDKLDSMKIGEKAEAER